MTIQETMYRDIKQEMSKRYGRDKDKLIALNKAYNKLSRYYRKTGKFPTDNHTASLIQDTLTEYQESLDKLTPLHPDRKGIEYKMEVLRKYMPAKFEYMKLDLTMDKPSDTNVKWEMYHNPNNKPVKNIKELRGM